MEFTEIQGVDQAVADKLKEAGLASIHTLQEAGRKKLASIVGPQVADSIVKQVGELRLDVEGRTDYLRTLGVRHEKEMDRIPTTDITQLVTPSKLEEKQGRRINVIIERSEARSPQSEKRQESYDLEIQPGWTVLDCLHFINEGVDPTLSFRRSCGQAICGICAVRVNSIPMLACNTQVDVVLGQRDTLYIQPLGNMPAIKDLVSDQQPFWKEVEKIEPWLIGGDEETMSSQRESIMYPDQLPDIMKMANCINCAVCFSDCDARRSAQEDFLGPMAAAKLYRFLADPRDAATNQRLDMAEALGIWKCMFAYQCAWCPKEVEPQEAIVMLRKLIIEKRGYKGYGARHSLAFLKSVQGLGRLDERSLPLITYGLFKTLRDIPDAIKWLLKGKHPRVHHVSGREDARKLVEALERQPVQERRESEG